jgi:hypothetical protein
METNVFDKYVNNTVELPKVPATTEVEPNVFDKYVVSTENAEPTNVFEKYVNGTEDAEPTNVFEKYVNGTPTSTESTSTPADNYTHMDKSITLSKADLLKPEYVNDLRKYMVDTAGVDYAKAEDQQVVDDFVTNMRWANTNLVSTSKMGLHVFNADDAGKATAGRAFEIYDQLGNVFTNDGVYGAATGVKDYIFAMAADPTNYVGLFTAGVAKAGAVGFSQAGKELVKVAASEALACAIF